MSIQESAARDDQNAPGRLLLASALELGVALGLLARGIALLRLLGRLRRALVPLDTDALLLELLVAQVALLALDVRDRGLAVALAPFAVAKLGTLAFGCGAQLLVAGALGLAVGNRLGPGDLLLVVRPFALDALAFVHLAKLGALLRIGGVALAALLLG